MNVSLFLEIKNEYTEHLVDTLTPFVYEGLTSIYKESVKIAEEANSTDKILLIFQKLLQGVPNWSQIKIDEETNRIKQLSNTADYLDDLVKAVIKSNIILLAYSNSISNIIGQTFYNNLSTSTFVHRCYTECSKDAHNNPYLFYHDVAPMDLKRNQMMIQENVQSGIARAVRKILPISMILKEYLANCVNIIQEPPNVELVGMKPVEPIPPQQTGAAIGQIGPNLVSKNPVPDFGNPIGIAPGVDPKLEREVMNMIKSDHVKSEAQKIKDIMNLDRIITSMEPNRVAEMSAHSLPTKKSRNMQHAPHFAGTDDYPENRRLTRSAKNLMDINFEEKSTAQDSSKKTPSSTSMPSNPKPTKIGKVERIRAETSERIDPKNVDLIEDYGMKGGKKNKKHR